MVCSSGACLETLTSSVCARLSGAVARVAAIAEAIINALVFIVAPCIVYAVRLLAVI